MRLCRSFALRTRSTAYRSRRPAQTLLELIAASTLVAVAMVPALKLIREGLKLGRETEAQQLIATYGVSKMEEHLAQVAAAWDTADEQGDFSADGNGTIHYEVTRTESAAEGGIDERLMVISVDVWEDADGDSNRDADELQANYRTKVANMSAYPSN